MTHDIDATVERIPFTPDGSHVSWCCVFSLAGYASPFRIYGSTRDKAVVKAQTYIHEYLLPRNFRLHIVEQLNLFYGKMHRL